MSENTQEPELSDDKVAHFTMVQFRSQTPVDTLEMTIGLAKQVIGPNLTIDLPYGEDYTLLPDDDLDVQVVAEVYRIFKLMDQPTRYVHVLQDRQDGLIQAVENMLGDAEYKLIRTKEEMTDLMLFHRGKKNRHGPQIIKRPRIGTMMEKIKQYLKIEKEEDK